MTKNKITAVAPRSKIVLYIWRRCPHSNKVLQDLGQLSDVIQERIEIIDVEDVPESYIYPPTMTCTPCMFISEISSDGARPMPLILNGRKQILLFCDLRAADATSPMDEREAMGADKISTFFQKTEVQESSGRGNMAKLVDHRHFDFVVDEASARASPGNGNRDALFDTMIDDPTVAQDPRVSRSVSDAMSELMKARGYAG